jgi:heterodisulfide reductase subunit A2
MPDRRAQRDSEEVEMARYLVVGGGITGLSAALDLAQAGHDVDVVERKSVVGGEVLSYCCKATDSCARCGVCVAHERIAEAARHERVRLYTGARLEAAEASSGRVSVQLARSLPAIDHRLCVDCGRCVSACPAACITRTGRATLVQYRVDHSACLLHQGKRCTACADACPARAVTAGAPERRESLAGLACLVATGHEPFSPLAKPRYGYGRLAGVMTGREAEELLARQSTLGDGVRSVGFVQCVGSRDPAALRPWCSAVCCAYAVRLARVIRHRDPAVDVTVYAIDLQSFDKCFAAFRQEVLASGVQVARGVPFRVDEAPGGRVRVTLDDAGGPTPSTREHDRLVLSVGMGPGPGSAETAGLFGLATDGGGFFRSAGESLFVAGTCARPQTIPECIGEAAAAASRMMRLASKTRGER